MELNPADRQASLWNDGSLYLALGGWAVILSALTTFLFAIFPLQLGVPVWQLNTISTLLASSANILTGSLLIYLARLFNPKDLQLKSNAALIRKLAGGLAVLMLVLIPFSLYTGSRAIKANKAASRNSLKQWKKQLSAVQALSSEADIRNWAASLPEPPVLPAAFDAPFPVIKQRMLDNLTGRINTVQNQIDENFRDQWSDFLKDFARNSIQSLLLALGFSAVSGRGIVPNFILSIARNTLGLGPNPGKK